MKLTLWIALLSLSIACAVTFVARKFSEQKFDPILNHSELTTFNTYDMKQAKIVFPPKMAKDIAKFLAENGIITNVSFSQEGGGLFSTEVVAYITFPDDKEDKVKANLQKYIRDEK